MWYFIKIKFRTRTTEKVRGCEDQDQGKGPRIETKDRNPGSRPRIEIKDRDQGSGQKMKLWSIATRIKSNWSSMINDKDWRSKRRFWIFNSCRFTNGWILQSVQYLTGLEVAAFEKLHRNEVPRSAPAGIKLLNKSNFATFCFSPFNSFKLFHRGSRKMNRFKNCFRSGRRISLLSCYFCSKVKSPNKEYRTRGDIMYVV